MRLDYSPTSAGPEWLKIVGVRELLDIDETAYHRYIRPAVRAGLIDVTYFGRSPRINRASLLAWLARRGGRVCGGR